MSNRVKNVLSIAGSDPSGGAGIQADLKTFAANGVYGMAAVTALTVQNTMGVEGIHLIPKKFVASQINAIFLIYVLAQLRLEWSLTQKLPKKLGLHWQNIRKYF